MITPIIDRLRRKSITKAAHHLGKMGYIRGKEGNISGRHSYTIWITPHNSDLRRLQLEEIIKITDRIPPYASSETPMHRAIYRKREEIKYIIHIHTVKTLALFEKIENPDLWDEVKIYVGNITVIKPLKPGTEELWKEVSKYAEETDFYILKKHGIISTGENITKSLDRIEIFEKIAEIHLLSK